MLHFTANQLTSVLNDSLQVREEEAVCAISEVFAGSSPRIARKIERLPGVPAHKLQGICTALNAQLTQLLVSITLQGECTVTESQIFFKLCEIKVFLCGK